MKVKQLIELLQEMPEDSDVLLAIDEEGNGFNTMQGLCKGLYPAGEPADWVDPEWTYEDAMCMDEEEWKERKAEMIPCIVLWP